MPLSGWKGQTAGLTDRQVSSKALSQHRIATLSGSYVGVPTIEAFDAYLLVPRDSADLDRSKEGSGPTPSPADLDCDRIAALAPADSNGLAVPS